MVPVIELEEYKAMGIVKAYPLSRSAGYALIVPYASDGDTVYITENILRNPIKLGEGDPDHIQFALDVITRGVLISPDLERIMIAGRELGIVGMPVNTPQWRLIWVRHVLTHPRYLTKQ